MKLLKMIASMVIFGSVGLFVSFLPFSSGLLAGVRALLGALSMAVVLIFRHKTINKAGMRKNAGWLIASGVALALNWVLLLEAYRYTTVAMATLCYYMAPLFVTVLAPLLLKERLTVARLVCTMVAVAGAVLIVIEDVVAGGVSFAGEQLKGMILALTASALYAAVILLTKQVKSLGAQETTFCQLSAAMLVALPIALFWQGDAVTITLSANTLWPLLVIGVIHTGVAYALFFDAAAKLPAQSTAILSYINPVTAILLTAFVIDQQAMTAFQIAGVVLIAAAVVIGELVGTTKHRRG